MFIGARKDGLKEFSNSLLIFSSRSWRLCEKPVPYALIMITDSILPVLPSARNE